MNNTAKLNIFKHTVYVIIILLLYVLQSVPGLFVIGGVKPIWIIPAAIAIAMFEGEFAGGIYGAFAGLLCDAGGFLLFGYNGFLVCLCCIFAGLLVVCLMRCNLMNCLMFSFAALLIRGSIEYFFAFGMWNYENSSLIYMNRTFPTVIYSTAVTVPVFFLFNFLHRRFVLLEEDGL